MTEATTQDNLTAATGDAALATSGTTAAATTATTETSTVTGSAVTDKVIAPTWRDDWRQELSGGDAKELARLERFNSPKDIFNSYRNIEKKVAAGEYKAALGKDATPEQVAEWRTANGIPAKAEEYYSKLADGLVVGEADKPIVNKILEAMHAKNASPEVVNATLDAYYKNLQEQQASMAEEDKKFASDSEEALRSEWGGDYRGNKNMISNFLDTAPEGLKDRLLGGSLADGRLIKDDPAAQQWLAGMARELNPSATMVPATGAGSIQSLATEQAAIAAKMGTKSYTDADRTRFTEIVETLEKVNKRK